MKLIFTVLIFSFIGTSAQVVVSPTIRNFAVLAQFKAGSGSGFYVRDSSSVYFATAYHVLFNMQTGTLTQDSLSLISYRDDVEADDKSILSVSLQSALAASMIQFDKSNDVAVVKLARCKVLDTAGNFSIAYLPFARKVTINTRINCWALSEISPFKDVTAGGDLYVIGYPKSLGLQGKFDLDRPLLRKGIVAGKDIKFHRIIGDGAVYAGNSGGMVFELFFDQKGAAILSLIGVVSEFIPFNDVLFDSNMNVRSIDVKNSGYSVIVPADEIVDLTKKMPI